MLQRQGGRCPLCGGPLLRTDREPQHPDEWEQWASSVPRAITSQAIAHDTDPGNNGGPAELRLIPYRLPTPPSRRRRQHASTLTAPARTASGLARAPPGGTVRFNASRPYAEGARMGPRFCRAG
jgi:hypothetical protein